MASTTKNTKLRQFFFWLGLVFFIISLVLEPVWGMTPEQMKMAGCTILMAFWWMGEAVPIPVTALMPLFLFPFLGILPAFEVSLAYGNHNVYLFLGGFLIALSMQKAGLDKRIALGLLDFSSDHTSSIVLTFMLGTAAISMWVSDTATVLMMMPIAFALLNQAESLNTLTEKDFHSFATSLMLGIAYAGVIGGIGTLVGTPPNLVFNGLVKELGFLPNGFSFLQWMVFAIPVTLIMLPVTYWVLTRLFFPVNEPRLGTSKDYIKAEQSKLGPVSQAELTCGLVFVGTVILWLTRGGEEGSSSWGWSALLSHPDYVNDMTVAVFAGCLLFMLPDGKGGKVLDWETASKLPWRILILFGGGFALAAGFKKVGLASWLALKLTFLSGSPLWILLLGACLLMTFATEVSSNTATASIMLPVFASVGQGAGVDPLLLMMAASMSASCAFMLPVATPGNAIVFGTGYIQLRDMAKVGFVLNVVGAIVITGVLSVLSGYVPTI